MKKWHHLLWSTLMVVSLLLPGYIFTDDAHAETPITSVDADAPHISPTVVNEHAGQKILFDNTHGETAGAADWVINGGFSDFGHALADDGYDVYELRQTVPLTYDDLKDYSVFVIPESNIPFKTSEQQALLDYVNNGGSVFFIGDHYNADRNLNRWDAVEVFNGYRRGAYGDPDKGMPADEASSDAMQNVTSTDWLSDHFGIRFRYNAVGDVAADQIVSPEDSFGITEGVGAVAVHAGSTLAITDPNQAKGLVYLPENNVPAWGHAVDQGVYNGGGKAEGPFAAISKLGKGKAAFIGDSSPVEDASPVYLREDTGKSKTTYDGFKEQDDSTFLINTIEWLSNQEDYTTFNGKIPLDDKTATLDFEDPANSTEPEAEPWSNPPAGYEWYDRSTFAPGSYGSGEVAAYPTYQFVHQSPLPGEGQAFQIKVKGENLAPLQAADNLKVGLYLPGGQQVGQFSLDGTNWPSNYGYSDPFSMYADADGFGTVTLNVKVKPGVIGQANLRLKQGSSTVFTETVQIEDTEVVPLPGDDVPDAVSISEVRDTALGTKVTTTGTVTTKSGLWGNKGFYIQDETGGVYVFQNAQDVKPGDVVKVTGQTSEYNGEFELGNLSKLEVTGEAEVPAVKWLSPDEVGDANAGELVGVKNAVISDVHKADGFGTTEFTATSAGESVVIRLDNRTGTAFADFPYENGDVLNIAGISSQFKGTMQIKPRNIDDLTLADTVAPVTEATVSGEQLSDGSYIGKTVLTLTATDDGTGVEKIEYQLNGGNWTAYQEPVIIDGYGDETIAYRAKDLAGNEESVKTLTITRVKADTATLKTQIAKADIHPSGIQRALVAKVDQVERAKSEAQKVKKLDNLEKFIAHQTGRHISRTAAGDLKMIISSFE